MRHTRPAVSDDQSLSTNPLGRFTRRRVSFPDLPASQCRDRVLKYAGGVVVILTGVDDDGTAAVARALAATLGWPHTRGGDPRALHAAIAYVVGRREHLVVANGPLTEDEQRTVRSDLHGVRFVDLAEPLGNTDEIVRSIRHEFGL
jgi:hypothetical protein